MSEGARMVNSQFVTVANNLRKLALLGQVVDRAASAGVPLIVLKGAALLDWVYDTHERSMSDVDILVRPEDCDRLAAAFEVPLPEPVYRRPPPSLSLFPHEPLAELDCDFKGLSLDVHLALFTPWWLTRILAVDTNGLWERAVPYAVAGRPALRLSPADQVVHLSGHAMLHHFEGYGNYFGDPTEDVRRVITRLDLDWDRVVALATAQRLRTATWLVLSVEVLSDVVPGWVVKRLKPSAYRRALIWFARRLQTAGGEILVPILLTDRPADPLRVIGITFVPPDSWLRGRYPSAPHPALRPLAHWSRLVWQSIRLAPRAVALLCRALRRSPLPRSSQPQRQRRWSAAPPQLNGDFQQAIVSQRSPLV
jgi:hypothetical protein